MDLLIELSAHAKVRTYDKARGLAEVIIDDPANGKVTLIMPNQILVDLHEEFEVHPALSGRPTE